MSMLIIDEGTNLDVLHPPGMGTGLVERDYDEFPEEMFAPPSDIQLIPESEWSDRIKEQEAQKSSLKHIWSRAKNGSHPPNLYQNGQGYCWSHSTTNAVMLARAVANMPYRELSAYHVAYICKGGRDQGGWCGESAKFIADVGVCEQRLWPQQRMQNMDGAEVRQNAALHKITEEWRDLTRAIHGQRMTFAQVATCLLLNQPCALDFSWWGHSVCGVRLVEVERGSFGIEILNSWGSSWSDNGYGVLRGNRAVPNGAIGIRAITAA